ncbi:MAG: monovalent cation/H+ antiporter subunit D family protein [Sneathiellaceae bacterium]
MIAQHFPILIVVLPLLASPLALLLRRSEAAWLLSLAVSWLLPFIALSLVRQTAGGEVISYAVGGWPPPIGIEYRIDSLSAFVMLLVSGVSALVVTFARSSVADEIPASRRAGFYAAYMVGLAGLLGMAASGDAFNIFVFMEISSLSSYVLIAIGRDRRALSASYRYLIMGTIGATFYVLGIGLLYAMTGTLNLADLAERLPAVENTRPVLAAFGFIVVGLSLKLALFPLHVWLPNAYAYAPSTASAFLASTATKVAIYLLLRFIFSVFGIDFSFKAVPLEPILLALSIGAILVASLVAMFQQNVKRMLAYSSIAQIGFITLGIAIANMDGMTGAIVHLFNHAVIKGALFLLVGCVVFRLHSAQLEDMAGIGTKMPVTMTAFAICGLAMVGAPGTAGFISKWFLAVGAADQGRWWLVGLMMVGSLLTLVYMARVLEIAFFRPPSPRLEKVTEAPLQLLLPALALSAATIWFGIDTTGSAGFAQQAAAALLGLPPGGQ